MTTSLVALLRDHQTIASEHGTNDVVQGSVKIYLTTGETITGQVDWIAEEGDLFSLSRIWRVKSRQDIGWDIADVPQYIVTASVVKIHAYQAGA
jgi:hypothetical protein